jgi:DNA-binding NarL/FixJ family response regulator
MEPGRPGRAEDLSRLFEAHYADMVRLAINAASVRALAKLPANKRACRVGRGRRPGRTRPNLTARELEVLALVAEGLRNAEIAQRLVISPKTVDHHVSAILAKPGVHTRREAAKAAARLGIGDTRPTGVEGPW